MPEIPPAFCSDSGSLGRIFDAVIARSGSLALQEPAQGVVVGQL